MTTTTTPSAEFTAMQTEIAELKRAARAARIDHEKAMKAAGDAGRTLEAKLKATTARLRNHEERHTEMKLEADVYRAEIATLSERMAQDAERRAETAETNFIAGIEGALKAMQHVSDLLQIPSSKDQRAGSQAGSDQGLQTRDHYTLGKAKFALRGLLYAVEGIYNDRKRPGRATEYGSVNTLAYAQRQLDQLVAANDPAAEMDEEQRRSLLNRALDIETNHYMATAFHEKIAAPLHGFITSLYGQVSGENVDEVLAEMRKRNAPATAPSKGAAVSADAIRAAMRG